MTPRQNDQRRDAGFTLVELMIAAVLLGLVLTLVGSVLIQGLRIQSTVQTSTSAASSSQLAAESLARGVHNALRLEISSPAAGISLIRTVSRSDNGAVPAGTLVCQAWVVADGEFRTRESATAIAAPTSAAEVQTWALLATGVEQTRRPDNSLVPVFTDLGNTTIDVAFTVDAPNASPVLVDTRLSALTPDPTAGLTCF